MLKRIEESQFTLLFILILGFIIRLMFMWYFKGHDLPDFGMMGFSPLAPLTQAVHLLASHPIVLIMNLIINWAIIFLSYHFALNFLHARLIALLTALMVAISPHFIYNAVAGLPYSLVTVVILTALILLSLRHYMLSYCLFSLSLLLFNEFALGFLLAIILFLKVEEKKETKFILFEVFKFFIPLLILQTMMTYFLPPGYQTVFTNLTSLAEYTNLHQLCWLFLIPFVLVSIWGFFLLNQPLRIRLLPVWSITIGTLIIYLLKGKDLWHFPLSFEIFVYLLFSYALVLKYKMKTTSRQLHHPA